MSKKGLLLYLSLALLGLVAACSRDGSSSAVSTNQETQNQPTPQPSPLTDFEKDLKFVRNGMFTYMWVVSRKDGKPLDKDDAAFLRKNAPQVVDWVSTDGKKAVGGTNFDLEKGNLELLKKRFVVEDYTGK